MPTSSRYVHITNTLGLNLRAADKLVRLASCFRAEVWVGRDGRRVNGNSILELVTLAAVCGCRLRIETDGPEADAALDALTHLIDRGFDDSRPAHGLDHGDGLRFCPTIKPRSVQRTWRPARHQ